MYAWGPLQRSWSGCELFNRHKIRVGKVSLHFQLELNTPGGFNVPTDKNLKNYGGPNMRPVPRKHNGYELLLLQETRP